MLCKRCRGGDCLDKICENDPFGCECPQCDGVGCDECEEGFFYLRECGRKYTREMITAVNLATYAEDKGILPTSGGMLDQSSWFISLWSAMSNEQASIDRQRMEGR
jgi:hypothetical protein